MDKPVSTVTMSTAFYLAARRWSMLVRRPIFCGATYGLLLYGMMNHVVVPLSAAGPGSKDALWITLTVAVHMVFVGIPIALAAKRALSDGCPGLEQPAIPRRFRLR